MARLFNTAVPYLLVVAVVGLLDLGGWLNPPPEVPVAEAKRLTSRVAKLYVKQTRGNAAVKRQLEQLVQGDFRDDIEQEFAIGPTHSGGRITVPPRVTMISPNQAIAEVRVDRSFKRSFHDPDEGPEASIWVVLRLELTRQGDSWLVQNVESSVPVSAMLPVPVPTPTPTPVVAITPAPTPSTSIMPTPLIIYDTPSPTPQPAYTQAPN